MDTPTVSRSGRLIKKSAKAIEMEGLDITDLETQDNKSRKKLKRWEDFDDKGIIQPIKSPKILLNVSSPASTSYSVPPKEMTSRGMRSLSKIPPFPSPVKSKLDSDDPLFQESSPENSKDFDSSSMSGESSSNFETEYNIKNRRFKMPTKFKPSPNFQKMPILQEKVIVEPCKQQFNSLTYIDQNTDLTMNAREDEASESNWAIAEETVNPSSVKQKGRKVTVAKRKLAKKPIAKQVRLPKPNVHRKYPSPKKNEKANQANEEITAFGLWFSEKRKQLVPKNSASLSSFSKQMGKIWKVLPKKEKKAWQRKVMEMSQKDSELISPEHTVQPPEAMDSVISEDVSQPSPEAETDIGTSPIDVAAHLTMLGKSLSTIGQKLAEHEGEIAVSGMLSVLLDSTLCALGPLLCLTSETEELNGCPQSTQAKILDNISYFMPGL